MRWTFRSTATKDERKHNRMNKLSSASNVIPIFGRDPSLDPRKASKNADRYPIEIQEGVGGRRTYGILGTDGGLLPLDGVLTHKATRALSMEDRFICWDYPSDSAEIVRLGAMSYYDLKRAAVFYSRTPKPSLLGQAIGLLDYRASMEDGALDSIDAAVTLEGITDAKGRPIFDWYWGLNL